MGIPLFTWPGDQPPADPGLIPLTVHEVKRLLAAALSRQRPPGHAARWLQLQTNFPDNDSSAALNSADIVAYALLDYYLYLIIELGKVDSVLGQEVSYGPY